jgi:predicted PurR-regulated permease PerM
MQTKTIEKYFFFMLLLGTSIFTFMIFRPFWIVLVLGASFAIVLYPVYLRLNKIFHTNWLSSLVTLLLFFVVLYIPLFTIGSIVFNQSQNLYHSILNNGDTTPFINLLGEKINHVMPNGVVFDINEKISSFVSFITSNIATIFSATISVLFFFVLFFLTIFYFLKDGEDWKKTLLRISPLSDKTDEKILDRLSETINGALKGYILIALFQGILMGIGLAIFHVPNWALWGAVAGVASIVPPFGTAIVSVPSIIFVFLTGHTGNAIGLTLWSTLIVGTGDNILTPYIIGHKLNIPPFLILFSVLGGISLIGPVGFLIGPIVVSLLYTLIDIYRSEFQ